MEEPTGGLTDLDRSPFAEDTRIGSVDFGQYSACELLATPGSNSTDTRPWTSAHSDNHAFPPCGNPTSSPMTENTFAPGAMAAPYPHHTWGPAVAKGPTDASIGADSQHPDPSLSTTSSFVVDIDGNGRRARFAPVVNRSFGRRGGRDRCARIHGAGTGGFRCRVGACVWSCCRKHRLDEHVRCCCWVVGAGWVQVWICGVAEMCTVRGDRGGWWEKERCGF